ncbi:threonine-phosphate decarboxylase [Hyphomicrobium sp. xq]|uniref:threonine-phosphate decarboxylase n=1 Tax=Hyphomicrobium album TaxID=2665159 RepID=A0A6I3KPS1_9HYPH|nr:threonine-phosphate decarboxylase CobD [Hyphomicrobium album]MTD95812.1 threonine-phosphate decarboxylase [Hyphomicrobium album]
MKVDPSAVVQPGASTPEGRAETIEHGGDLAAARLRFPAAPEPWIDLSTGINPHAYPLPAIDADLWERLPQASDEQAVLQAAAQRYGCKANNIVAAPGSQALIQVLPRLFEPSDVVVLGPTYGEHAAAWERCGHRVVERRASSDIGEARVAVVVNPNNPTGRVIAANELRALAAVLAQRRGLLVVDEAFADFAEPGVSVAAQLPPATVVLRSFGKAYGIAGARLGFAVADPTLCARLSGELGPWAVSGPALAIGSAALADERWLAAMRVRLAEDRRRLDTLLQACGLVVEGGTHLFCLARHAQARAIADKLGRSGIHVRRFAAEPKWLRFGLPGAEAEWERLADATTAE